MVRILAVDDVLTNRLLVQQKLEQLGHRVILAASGTEALDRLKYHHFDLILLDVQMPGLDGFEVTRRIRERERNTGKRTPIIAMTAHAMKGDRERCLESGMPRIIL